MFPLDVLVHVVFEEVEGKVESKEIVLSRRQPRKKQQKHWQEKQMGKASMARLNEMA